jgi:hypothetical protein
MAVEKPSPSVNETIDMLEPTPDMNGNTLAKVTQPLFL